MINLRRLNGTPFILNAELIEQIEQTPDTVITLTTGNNIVVLDDVDSVIEKILAYRQNVNVQARAQCAAVQDAVRAGRGD